MVFRADLPPDGIAVMRLVPDAATDAAALARSAADRAAGRASATARLARELTVAIAVGWSVSLPAVTAVVWGLAALAEGDPEDVRQAPFAFGFAAVWTALVVSAWRLVSYLRATRPRAIGAAMQRLGAAYGRPLAQGAEAVVPTNDWLEARWPFPVPLEVTTRTARSEARWALALASRSTEALVVAVRTPEPTSRTLCVFVTGAHAHGLSDAGAVEAFALGFTAERSPTGVRFTHRGDDARALEPQRVERLFALAAGAADASRPAREPLLARLLEAGAVRASDLAANRAARRSGAQHAWAALQALLGVAASGGALAWGWHVLTAETLRDRAGREASGGARVFGAVLYAAIAMAAAAFAVWRVKTARATVVALDGPARVSTGRGHRGALMHYVAVGPTRFTVSERLAHAILPGAIYRAYHGAGSDELLSIEPVDDGA